MTGPTDEVPTTEDGEHEPRPTPPHALTPERSQPTPARPQTATSGVKLTPMLEQYLRVKQEHADALLFFRMGDFYEMFFDDAERAARLLDITLTTRSRKDDVPIPMCGVPHHAIQAYVAKVLAAGLKVALCDQMEDPSAAKGLVARAVVRVLTPGTVTEEEYLDPNAPTIWWRYIATVRRHRRCTWISPPASCARPSCRVSTSCPISSPA
jgi:DNA mismatch repair ATPase MutS